MNLITTDEYPAYEAAILETWGYRVVPLPQYKPGRRALPYRVPPPHLTYAMVHKTRKKGRVVKVECKQVFGTGQALSSALKRSSCSTAVNTAFIERHNGTDRHHNARKARQTYRFSKNWEVHVGMTYFTMYSYNFCWPVRTLAKRHADGHVTQSSPAMAAGLAQKVWSIHEWITLPAVQAA
jgi:IS1 family transposase